MKKKTRQSSSSSSSLALPFWTALFVCLAGAVLSSVLFYRSFFQAFSRLNESPIATITFKYKTAQRKFLDRVVWDRLRQNSPVYNGDTIHTSTLSEATIWFKDGNVMDLSENTMAQVFLKEDKSLSAELAGGEALIDASGAEKGMTLGTGGVQVAVEAGASLNAKSSPLTENGGGVSFQVLGGKATVGGNTVSAGESVNVSGQTVTRSAMTVTTPLPNQKILYHTKEDAQIPFVWQAEQPADGTEFLLEISQDKDFAAVTKRAAADSLTKMTVALPDGAYYWRVRTVQKNTPYDAPGSQSVSGKIQVIQSLPPETIAPVADYAYQYRTRYPAVRFIWSESPYATSYNLIVADNPSFSNPKVDERSSLTSCIISTLGEGSYYWKVIPYYTINKTGLAQNASSQTGKFTVQQRGELSSPVPVLPSVNGLVNTEKDAKAMRFSWRMEPEAVSYTLRIASSENLSSPAVDVKTDDNCYTLNPAATHLEDGKWYWSVTQTDNEGNVSPSSAPRMFYAMKGAPEQHTIEPVDGYRCAESLVQDMQFTWKRSLPAGFVSDVQISADPAFGKLLYTSSASGSGMSGINLPAGTYYWRLHSVNTDDNTEIATGAKSFSILGPLEATVLNEPLNKAVARESTPYSFKWNEVPDADFYKFRIYRASDNELVREDTVYDLETKVDMFNGRGFEDRTMYRWEVQAQANAVPGVSSRRTGRVAENTFYLVKLRPVEITSPKYNEEIKGVDAIINPGKLAWSSVDAVAEAQLVLTRTDVTPNETVMKVPDDDSFASGKKVAPNTIQLVPLHSGTYEAVVYAKTTDDIDISNSDKKNIGRFTVLPVEPLASVTGLVASPARFDVAYLTNRNNPRSITLSWQSVRNATDYLLEISSGKGWGKKSLIKKDITKGTSYTLDISGLNDDDKRLFSKGTFTWTVQAVRRIDDAYRSILQESDTASSQFITDLPTPKKAVIKGASNAYGK